MSFSDLFDFFGSFPSYVSKRSFCSQESTSWLWVHPELPRQGRQFGRNDALPDLVEPMLMSASDKGGDCCPLVADSKTVLVLLAFVAAATYFLRQEITKIKGKRKRRHIESHDSESEHIFPNWILDGVEEVQDNFDGILKTAPWITGLFSTHDWNEDQILDLFDEKVRHDSGSRNSSSRPDGNNCLAKMMTCFEEGTTFVKEKTSVNWIIQKSMTSMFLKGNLDEIWKEVMSTSEVDGIGNCISFKNECFLSQSEEKSGA